MIWNSRPSSSRRVIVSSPPEGSTWSAAVERSVRALSMKRTRPPGFRQPATISQNVGEAVRGHVGEPEGEHAGVIALVGRPVEQVGLEVADGRVADAGAVDGQHLGGGVDRGHRVGVVDEVPRPQAGPAGQLQHVAAGIEALEHALELGGLGEPAGVGLRPAVEAALAHPPLVVLQRAGAVVVELLGEDGVVGHRAHRNLARRAGTETARTLPTMATTRAITDEAQLREIIGEPTALVVTKIADRLNDLTRQFIERSPFVCVGTSSPDGGLDVSPRGDPAGFVRILDERTLLLPDRPGNRIADTLTNLLDDPRIALLFLIPGVGDTFRVNGTAEIIDDPELLADSTVDGKPPRLGLLVAIEECYTQCPKAMIRSELWNPERHIDRSELPSSGAIFRSLNDPSFDADEYDREREARYKRREGLY